MEVLSFLLLRENMPEKRFFLLSLGSTADVGVVDLSMSRDRRRCFLSGGGICPRTSLDSFRLLCWDLKLSCLLLRRSTLR